MTVAEFKKLLLQQFKHEPTLGQVALVNKISTFCASSSSTNVFVLKGFAGTGKTSLISALIKSLSTIGKKTILLAPTGRAAKVLSHYSQKQAFTIHKKIYRRITNADGIGHFVLQSNMHTKTIFIVDEASMIANEGGLSEQASLLDDLINYVIHSEGCKLIFVGDTAQLPPVHLNISPALDVDYLKRSYSINLDTVELKDVMRQVAGSGILTNATTLRNLITEGRGNRPQFDTNNFTDIVRLNGNELEDYLSSAYNKKGVEETVVICRSNKRANQFNQQIRARIRWQENELSSGDYMMVVKNNYYWLPDESKAGFIANGDSIELLKAGDIKEQYGFRFADARIRLVDYPNEQPLEVKLMIDTIGSESPALTADQNKKLYQNVMSDYMHIKNKSIRFIELKKNPFLNALQVKFAYAITCHKAQGGQWENVFVDQGYLTNDMINTEYMRWLYTAVTRATKKLYLINFNKTFFGDEL